MAILRGRSARHVHGRARECDGPPVRAFLAVVLGAGLLPRRWVTLEVVGRRTGRVTRFPLGMADWHGDWYLVSMLGTTATGSATYVRRAAW